MGNSKKKKGHGKSNKWTPPKGSTSYFSRASDYDFQSRHPIGYGFLCVLSIVALMLPLVLYIVFVLPYDINSPWILLGGIGGFIVGIGLFNFVAIIIKQYLGHIVSILSFIVGGLLILISLLKMGII